MARTITPAFWRGKRVLVTGHTGFKGAWACLLLEQLGARVAGLSLAPEEPSLYSQAGIGRLLDADYIVDLEDAPAVQRTIDEVQPEIVLHFAAQSLVRRAHREPVRTFASNVLGTVHLLEALRSCTSLQTVLITTTDKVYFNAETGKPFREGDRLGGLEPYGASKAAAEIVISAYRASYFAKRGVPVLVARAGNVIGGGDWCEDRILPDIIRSVIAGEQVHIRNPGSVRPWQLVLDALEGYFLLVEHKGRDATTATDPEDLAWNFGPAVAGEMITVEQICHWVAAAWPDRFSWVVTPDRSGIKESGLLLLDPAKAMADLGWTPRLGPEAAVRKTLGWYREFLDGQDALSVSRRHIADHFPVLAKARSAQP